MTSEPSIVAMLGKRKSFINTSIILVCDINKRILDTKVTPVGFSTSEYITCSYTFFAYWKALYILL